MSTGGALAIMGVAGTVAGAAISARVSPWAHGRADRRNRVVLDLRVDAYSDLLKVTGRLRENAMTRASVPLAELDEPPLERITALDARIRVVGSDGVREATDRFASLSARFLRELFAARELERVAHESGAADTIATLAARDELAKTANAMSAAIDELERRIRAEMKL